MHIAPRGLSDDDPNVDHTNAAARMAAAEDPKIIDRRIPLVSTVVQSLLDIIDDVLRLDDLAVVFPHQLAIRSHQHHIDQMAYRAIRLDLAAQLETRERLVNVAGTSGQEIPALLIGALLLRIVEQLFGAIMLGIDGDRNERHLRTEIAAEAQCDVRKLCRLHQARPRARRVDEIHHHRLALERREDNSVAILIDELGVSEHTRSPVSGRAAMTSSSRKQARECYESDAEGSEITTNSHMLIP